MNGDQREELLITDVRTNGEIVKEPSGGGTKSMVFVQPVIYTVEGGGEQAARIKCAKKKDLPVSFEREARHIGKGEMKANYRNGVYVGTTTTYSLF